jgi:malonate decarboxylase gamma subunit
VILVDTQGQRLRHRDEMLGINSYMAHLGKCVELARRQGHRVIGLVYDQALSGGFITSGLIADACYALPDATIRVMGLPAMAHHQGPGGAPDRTGQKQSGVCPGPENYLRMGGVAGIWNGDLAVAAALAHDSADTRAATGLERADASGRSASSRRWPTIRP